MAINDFTNRQSDEGFTMNSYSSVMREIGSSTKELIESEINLFLAELKVVGQNVGRHTTEVMLFGFLLAISTIPFLAFLVIGLGEWLDGRYWLSSLVVALVCALIGGPMAYRSFKKIKESDLKMPHSTAAFKKEVETVQKKFEDLKTTVKGDHHESH